MLRIVVLLEALPWFTAGTIAARSDQKIERLANFGQLPTVLVFVLFFTGLAGVVGYQILVYNRLTILFYARAINGFRSLYADTLPDVRRFMPTDTGIPATRERRGIMFLLSLSLGAINTFYLGVATFNISRSVVAAVVVAIATGAFLFGWYWRVTRQPIIQGFVQRPSASVPADAPDASA